MQKRKRDQSRQLQKDEHELLETPRKKQNCAVAEESGNQNGKSNSLFP